jgi:hypothetical protein
MIDANIIDYSITKFIYKTPSKAQHTSILNWKHLQDYCIQKLKMDILFSIDTVYSRRVLIIWKLSFVISEEMWRRGRLRIDRRY